jgi:hypothetical protein
MGKKNRIAETIDRAGSARAENWRRNDIRLSGTELNGLVKPREHGSGRGDARSGRPSLIHWGTRHLSRNDRPGGIETIGRAESARARNARRKDIRPCGTQLNGLVKPREHGSGRRNARSGRRYLIHWVPIHLRQNDQRFSFSGNEGHSHGSLM